MQCLYALQQGRTRYIRFQLPKLDISFFKKRIYINKLIKRRKKIKFIIFYQNKKRDFILFVLLEEIFCRKNITRDFIFYTLTNWSSEA